MIERGQIYFVNLNPIQGKEQAGLRPVLVVSVNAINSKPLVVAVVVGTDAKNIPRNYTVNVRAYATETGLPMDTVFMCFQLRSQDPARFTDPKTGQAKAAGAMPEDKMKEVEKALGLVLGLKIN
ncbi:MAG: type II toxin-antitoxin system PemK/MazF family toxin [Elusimicrobia bacterium]|nr:type II toxin-antitoxin system PemK/MazF family toxin [Elusimicrobiota bacterium]